MCKKENDRPVPTFNEPWHNMWDKIIDKEESIKISACVFLNELDTYEGLFKATTEYLERMGKLDIDECKKNTKTKEIIDEIIWRVLNNKKSN